MATPNENPDYAPKIKLKTTEGWSDEPPKLDYISEVKTNVRSMPYGDFMDMVLAINADATKLWGWANSS